jgi:hypothetical protein
VPAEPTSDESRAEILLREALAIMAPLTRALISHGVTYPVFAQALKSVFLQAARIELQRENRRTTDSALSLLSGVHRKDVRALASEAAGSTPDRPAPLAPPRRANLSMAAQVFARWIRDPAFADPDGRPLTLPIRAATTTSFESLAKSVSKDFHARSVLDELLRLRLVEVDGDRVRPAAGQFTPAAGFAELAYYFGSNVRDHLSAGAANLNAVHDEQRPPFLEHAMFADGLTEQSIAELQELARQIWTRAMTEMYGAARQRVDADAPLGAAAQQRMRFGAYFFAEPDADSADLARPAGPEETQ